MAADGKWVEGLTAETKWSNAAESVFTARLNAVESNWKAALEETMDPEPVHQMRVATRRARAAVQIFADVLPKKVERELSQLLKKLRNAFGPARDWDVFHIHLQDWAANRSADEQPGLGFLSGMALSRRQSAQRDLEKSTQYRATWDNLRPKVKLRGGKRLKLGDRAAGIVGTMLVEFRQTTEKDLRDAESLHQVRIAGKRLRYALELFVDVLDVLVRERLLPMMEELQDILGHANDANNLKNQIESGVMFLPRLGEEKARHYLVGINPWFEQLTYDAADGYPRFQEWLGRFAGHENQHVVDDGQQI